MAIFGLSTTPSTEEDEKEARSRAARSMLGMASGLPNTPIPGIPDSLAATPDFFRNENILRGATSDTAPNTGAIDAPINWNEIAVPEEGDDDPIPGFTGDYAVADRNARSGLTDLQRQLQRRRQVASEDYDTALSRSVTAQDLAYKQLQEAMAARGTLGSSINLSETGEQNRRYQEFVDDLNRGYNRTLTDVINEWATGQRNYTTTYQNLITGQRKFDQEAALQKARLDQEAQRLADEAKLKRDEIDAINLQTAALREYASRPPQIFDFTGIKLPGAPAPDFRSFLAQLGVEGFDDLRVALPSDYAGSPGSTSAQDVESYINTAFLPALQNVGVYTRDAYAPEIVRSLASGLGTAGRKGLSFKDIRNLITNIRYNYGAM